MIAFQDQQLRGFQLPPQRRARGLVALPGEEQRHSTVDQTYGEAIEHLGPAQSSGELGVLVTFGQSRPSFPNKAAHEAAHARLHSIAAEAFGQLVNVVANLDTALALASPDQALLEQYAGRISAADLEIVRALIGSMSSSHGDPDPASIYESYKQRERSAMPALTFSQGVALPDRMYVDSNVAIAFLYGTHTHHHAAAAFFLESLSQSKRLLFSVLVMDELWHILMGTWHRESLGSKFDPKNKGDVARWAGQVQATTKRLLAISNVGLCAAPSVTQLCDTALATLRDHHLGARDAFHVATAREVGISAIATADGDFDDLPGLTIVKIA